MFSKVGEAEVTRALVRGFLAEFDEHVRSDVLVAGAGPAGLMCGKELAERGLRVLLVERNNYLGGGFWIGGYLMNKVVVRTPAEVVLRELEVPFTTVADGLHVADGPHACAKLVAAACDAGVRALNMTSVDDVVMREQGRVAGLVVNWSAVQALPRQISCVDPVALEADLVVDATGHDATVASLLAKRGLLEVPGCGAMWVERSEDEVVRHTGEVHPGLVAVGMSVASIYALPRMGPSFGAMLLSGKKGAATVLELLAAGRKALQPMAG